MLVVLMPQAVQGHFLDNFDFNVASLLSISLGLIDALGTSIGITVLVGFVALQQEMLN